MTAYSDGRSCSFCTKVCTVPIIAAKSARLWLGSSSARGTVCLKLQRLLKGSVTSATVAMQQSQKRTALTVTSQWPAVWALAITASALGQVKESRPLKRTIHIYIITGAQKKKKKKLKCTLLTLAPTQVCWGSHGPRKLADARNRHYPGRSRWLHQTRVGRSESPQANCSHVNELSEYKT